MTYTQTEKGLSICAYISLFLSPFFFFPHLFTLFLFPSKLCPPAIPSLADYALGIQMQSIILNFRQITEFLEMLSLYPNGKCLKTTGELDSKWNFKQLGTKFKQHDNSYGSIHRGQLRGYSIKGGLILKTWFLFLVFETKRLLG